MDLKEVEISKNAEAEACLAKENVTHDNGGVVLEKEEECKLQDEDELALLSHQQKEEVDVASTMPTTTPSDRFNYLLQQTEIFGHFIKGSASSPAEQEQSGKKRGRKTEREEDEELLQEVAEDEQTPIARHLTCSPQWVRGGTMRDYQIEGLNWLIKLYDTGLNGILADEMGLGKTLQTISLLGYLKHERSVNGPHIIIVPKSTLSNWINEFSRWCPTLKVLPFHGNKEERAELKEKKLIPGTFDVLVTTYEMAIIEKSAFVKFSWHYIIIDEAHRIKNENARLSQIVRLYKSQSRLLLTGTPLQNNLHELWALLNFLLPDVFGSSEDFDSWFNLSGEGEQHQQEIISKLHTVLRPFLLRRLKTDVERKLPPKKEIKLFVGMSAMQKEWYMKIITKDIDAINGAIKGKAIRVRLLNILMQLRKACNHPYLFHGAEPGPPYLEGEHLITNSGKMVLLDKLLPKLKAQGSRVLLFSQMTRLLDILEDYLVYRGYQYCRIDGSTNSVERGQAIDNFNALGSRVFAFLLSTRAGGLGINLATADTVVLYDSDWNPQVDLQAQDRAHRIGQTKPVTVFRFVTDGTVEQKIIERAEAKLHLDAMVIQQGRLVEKDRSLGREELLSMIRFGADHIFKTKDSTITDEDIDLIISKGAERTEELNTHLKKNHQSLLSFSSDGTGTSLYEFQGVDYKGLMGKRGGDWSLKLPSRTRKATANYSVDGYYRSVLQPDKVLKKYGSLKPPKQPIIHKFQFYPARLHVLLAKEADAYKKKVEFKEQQDNKKREAEKDEMEEAEPDFGELTAEETEEKEQLLAEGFRDWSKRDFNTFLKACERFGRDNIDAIVNAMKDSKSPAEVERYAAIFWERGAEELSDWDKIVANIERGESKLRRKAELAKLLERKVSSYKNPWKELKIAYTASRGRSYTPEEDQFIVCMTHKLGHGNWEQLRAEIRRSSQFRFDWFLRSRTALELNRRCDVLIKMIEKELSPSAKGVSSLPDKSTKKRQRVTKESNAAASLPGALSKRRRVSPTSKRDPNQDEDTNMLE